MKTSTLFARRAMAAAAILMGAALAVPALAAPPPAKPAAKPGAARAAAPLPMPKILVINRQAILRGSKVGQDIARQVKAYTEAAEKELKGQGDALRSDQQKLQQQLAILSAAVKAKKIADFQARARAFQSKAQQREGLIEGGEYQANTQVEKAVGPIVQGIMAERGANMLLDRQAVIVAPTAIDITAVAIQRLDQKMPKVKVQLVAPPAGLVAQQQQR